jgi:hypothetical protein
MSNPSVATVKLKYHSSEISVPLHNCDYLHETSSVFESIPIELEALLLLAKSELSNDSKSIPWRLMDTEDKKEKIGNIECILLGRSSYFHQIRNLVWDLESKLSKNNGNHLEAKHPKTGDIVENFEDFEPGIDYFEGVDAEHNKLFDNMKYTQYRWDDRSIFYYVDREGNLIQRIFQGYTYPTGISK